MKSLREILREEKSYWEDVAATTNNRLLRRIAYNNIYKRLQQLRKLGVTKV